MVAGADPKVTFTIRQYTPAVRWCYVIKRNDHVWYGYCWNILTDNASCVLRIRLGSTGDIHILKRRPNLKIHMYNAHKVSYLECAETGLPSKQLVEAESYISPHHTFASAITPILQSYRIQTTRQSPSTTNPSQHSRTRHKTPHKTLHDLELWI